MKRTCILAAFAAVVLAACPVWGQEAASVQQALNKTVNASIPDATISEVFAKLGDKTGVKFIIDDDTAALLPYGLQTHMTVTLQNIALRDALGRLLAPLALRWQVDGGSVRIVPTEALYRVSRRATFGELQVLGRLLTGRLAPSATGGPMLEQLRTETKDKDLKLVFPAGATDESRQGALTQGEKVLPGAPADFLDMMTAKSDWTWYLWGDDIVILPKVKQVERQLGRTVSLRYQNEKLMTVLLDLARQARVKLELSPGVLTMVPSDIRNNFSLMMADAPVSQALEVISGATGLTFSKTGDGIFVEASPALANKATGAATTGPTTTPGKRPFMVRMVVDVNGKSVEVFLRSDELPDDVVDAIQNAKQQFIDQVRSAKAATRPAP